MIDPALPASTTASANTIEERLARLERRLNFWPAVLPIAPVFGANQGSGFHSHSLTTVSDVYRCDAYLTAPVLDYDIQQTDAYATSSPTTITVEVKILGFGAFSDTVLVTDTQAPDAQIAGFVDLIDTLGEDILGRFASFRIRTAHTGGTGEAVAARLNKPLTLRTLSV